MSRNMTKPIKWLCTQGRLRSVWASAQSNQSLRCPHEESLGPYLPIECTAKTMIWLGGCPCMCTQQRLRSAFFAFFDILTKINVFSSVLIYVAAVRVLSWYLYFYAFSLMVGRHNKICRPKPALLVSGHPPTGLLSPGIVYTNEGTGTNRTLMQNLDQYLITNRLHVTIYSVSRFRACYLHRYVV